MDLLLTFVPPVGLFLALELFWCRPPWLNPLSGPRGKSERWPAAPRLLPDSDPFSLSFVRNRMDILTAEMERLDDDPAIFARAFRMQVAKSAYKALMDDAIRLGNASRLAALSPLPDITVVEIEIWNSLAPLQEELEI